MADRIATMRESANRGKKDQTHKRMQKVDVKPASDETIAHGVEE